MKEKVPQAISIYGADVCLNFLTALQEEIPGVRLASDIEHIHRMRVASRRLREALDLFASDISSKNAREWLREIRRVTRALGAARDCDVQLEAVDEFLSHHPDPAYRQGLLRLKLRLSQRREKYQVDVLAALDHFESSQALTEMKLVMQPLVERRADISLTAAPLCQLSFDAIRGRCAEFVRLAEYLDSAAAMEEHHEMRIAAKHLRYALEIFEPLYPDGLKNYIKEVRNAQELLGNLHDCDVWLEFLEQFRETEKTKTLDYFGHTRPMRRMTIGLLAFEDAKYQERMNWYDAIYMQWQRWEQQDLWTQLLFTVRPSWLHNGDDSHLLSFDLRPHQEGLEREW